MPDLYLRTYGQSGRPALVLLHGLFGSSSNWGSVARRLESDYYVLAPDLRNHGQSPHTQEHSYEAMAGDVLRLLDQQAVAQAIFVGHSMGGKVAMHLALNRPQRVRAVASVDMSPVAYTHNFEAVLAGLRAIDLATIADRKDADRQLAGKVTGAGVRGFLLQNLVRRESGWAWRLNLAVLAEAQRAIVGFPAQREDAVFEGPASFIHGELSNYVTLGHRPIIKRFFPHASFCQVSEAGHWVYADQPQGFADCLDRFLDRVNGQGLSLSR